MSKIDKDKLGYLGIDFQYRLLQQIIVDRKFGESIIDIMTPNYFEDAFLRSVAGKIKDNYEKYETIPDMNSLESILYENIIDEVDKEMYISSLKRIKEAEQNNSLRTQDIAMKFCKQQELKKSVREMQLIIEKGDLDDYHLCEELLKKALEVGHSKDDGIDVFYDIESVLSEDFRDPIPTGIDGLDTYMDGGLAKGELAVILAPTGVGKAQPLTSKILTPNGWTTMGKIQVNDFVIGDDGKKTKVIGVFPQGKRPIYEIKFNDGTSTLCDEEHLWSVNTINQRNRKTKKNGKVVYLPSDDSFKTIKTKDMLDDIKKWGGKNNYKIPIVKPVQFENNTKLPIDPYVMGLILGDGCITDSNQPRITTKDEFIVNEVKSRYNDVNIYSRERYIEENSTNKIMLNKRSILEISLLGAKSKLSDLKLYGCNSESKFIPNLYLFNTIENRLSLLQGLIDSDGYINSHRIEYVTVSESLCNGMIELIRSLGGKVSFKTKIGSYKNKLGEIINCKKYYRLSMSLPNNGIIPSLLPRKRNKFINREKYSSNKFITSIEYHGHLEAQCIMVDNINHLYVTDDYIVTHNTTLSTKLANHAKNIGKNVLQIFFEDNPKIIQKKHLTCWMEGKYTLNELSENKEEIFAVAEEMQSRPGTIRLKKFPSDSTTIPIIKQYIKKLMSQGFKPDLVILDYIDCVQSSKQYKESWDAEGNVMRQFETMLSELDMAGWTAVQGNRCVSIDTHVVTKKNGNIKIKDIVEGDEILTHKGYKKVTHVFPIEKQPIYKIKLKSGKTINVSKKHKFPTSDGKLLSIQDGLKVGDKLLTK